MFWAGNVSKANSKIISEGNPDGITERIPEWTPLEEFQEEFHDSWVASDDIWEFLQGKTSGGTSEWVFGRISEKNPEEISRRHH